MLPVLLDDGIVNVPLIAQPPRLADQYCVLFVQEPQPWPS
jgi:hypothetical protein